MKIGYTRASTEDQNPDLQIQALKKAGCKTIYTDKVGGTVIKRPHLDIPRSPADATLQRQALLSEAVGDRLDVFAFQIREQTYRDGYEHVARVPGGRRYG